MPAARPLKRRASSSSTAACVDPAPNHSFQLTFASPSAAPSDLPSAPPPHTQGALALQPTISFAPNITPGTYTAPPPSDDILLGLDGDSESGRTTLFPDACDVDRSLTNLPVAKRRRKNTPTSTSRATPIPTKAAASMKKPSKSSSSKAGSPEPAAKSSDSSQSNSTEAPAHIPRPPNAFILFRSSFIRSQHVSAETEGNHGTLSKIVGMLWHALSYEERQVWQAKARRAYAEHKKMYPGYSFRPVKDKNGTSSNSTSTSSNSNVSKSEREATPASFDAAASAPKRKTRTVGPRDLQRCEHIAALLARGLKGAGLDAAMKEFDAARAPQTFTPRFEVPLTAQAYAPQKDNEANETKREAEEVKCEKEEKEETVVQRREKTVEPVVQQHHTLPDVQTHTQALTPAALAMLRPRRVRRSSSAPLLDAGMPISAPQPVYPSPHSHFYHPQPQSQQLGQQQLEHDDVFQFGQEQQVQQQAYPPLFAFSQLHTQTMHVQDGIALRKRSASSSPPIRRPSYSFAYPQVHPQLFASHYSTPHPQQQQTQEPQPFAHAYSAAHPHLQHMQAQMHAQSQARMQGQQESQTLGLGLGLEFDQAGSQPSYDGGFGGQHESGGLSRQSTLTDISSDVDFSSFSFMSPDGRDSQTPISAHPTNPNPFEAPPLSAAPSSASVDEMEYNYADMPVLVDAPLYQSYYQHQQQQQPPARSQHHPQLEIQTSWTAEDFTFDHGPASAASVPPSSALDIESVPPSAVSGAFDFPPTATRTTSALVLESGYLDYPAPPQTANTTVTTMTPCSPASQSTSGAASSAGARTPIDDAFGSWDAQPSSSSTVASSPVNSFDGCGAQNSDAIAHALQAGFRAFVAHAEKMGAFENTDVESAYEQFARFVQGQGGLSMGMSAGGMNEMGGMGGLSAFGGEAATQMADVM